MGPYDALMIATLKGHRDIVELLINHNAHINIRDNVRQTALMRAAMRSHQDVIKLLLANGADKDAKNKDGWTALMCAAFNGCPGIDLGIARYSIFRGMGQQEIVKLLINNNAQITIKNKSGQTASEIAEENGYTEIANLLKEKQQEMVTQ